MPQLPDVTLASPESAALRDIPGISAIYMRQLLDIGERWGSTRAALVHNVGLSYSQLERADARVSSRQMGRVARRITRVSGREDIGMAFGMAFRPQDFGQLGHALMASATLGDALGIMYRYRHMLVHDVDRTIEITPAWVTMTLHARYDMEPTRQNFFEALMVVLYRMAVFLTARRLPEWQIIVDWPEPRYFDNYRAELGPWTFEQGSVALKLPRAYLDLPLFMADESALQRALEGVDFEFSRRERLSSENVVAQVRALLKPGRQGFPDLKTVAGSLCVSERSLNRRLKTAGTHFQALLDEARKALALNMLLVRRWPLQQISNALGFTEPAAFTRAFTRWTGMTPTQYRRTHEAGAADADASLALPTNVAPVTADTKSDHTPETTAESRN